MVQYPAFFLQYPRTMSYFPEKIPIPGKMSRFQENFVFLPKPALFWVVEKVKGQKMKD